MVDLPPITFKRAGTTMPARLWVIDKAHTAEEASGVWTERSTIQAEDLDTFFEEVRYLEAPPRFERTPKKTESAHFELIEGVHTKHGHKIFTLRQQTRIEKTAFASLRDMAKDHDGYYSSYRKAGAVPGWIFRTRSNAEAFMEEATTFIDRYATPEAVRVAGFFADGIFRRRRRPPDTVDMPASLSASQSVEEAMRAAEGLPVVPWRERARASITEARKAMTRTFQHLDPKTDGEVIDLLRQYRATAEWSTAMAHDELYRITAKLGPKRMRVFARALILPDILKDIEAGLYSDKKLPFGFKSRKAVEVDLKRIQAIVDANPDIRAALNLRRQMNQRLTHALVVRDLLPSETLDDPRYWHRQVLKYFGAAEQYRGPGLSAGDVRLHKKGFQRKRKGGEDFNTDYFTSEFEWVSQAYQQTQTFDLLQRIESVSNIRPDLVQMAAEMRKQGEKVKWEDLVPEGYTIWQPEVGNMFYRTWAIDDEMAMTIMLNPAFREAAFGGADVEVAPEDIRKVLAVGGKKAQWVIPTGLAQTLDTFRTFEDVAPLERLARKTGTAWKQWTLLSPLRVFRYNINNMSGDLDIALAYSPRILKHFRASASLALRYMRGQASDRQQALVQLAIQHGVYNSGLRVQEIDDIKAAGLMSALTGERPGLIGRYWESVRDFTDFRENILRLAAFQHFREELARRPNRRLYGASKRRMMDQLYDGDASIDEISAKLARELIGDYGAISEGGQWLRRYLIPFYSWLEINAPRYVRLLKNTGQEGGSRRRVGAALAGRVALSSAGLAVRANMLLGLVMLFNKTFFEEEDEQIRRERGQVHLILGRNEDGTIRSLRIQGALSDALDWFRLSSASADLLAGDRPATDVVADVFKAPVERIYAGSAPIPKTAIEVATGRTVGWPRLFKKGASLKFADRAVRDRGEHAARLLSLQWLYRKSLGIPAPTIEDYASSLIYYRTDPQQAAYYRMRERVFDWLREQDIQAGSSQPTPRSNALFYWRQALRYEDPEAAERWYNRYIELGGTPKGVRQSIKRQWVLDAVPRRRRREFLATLSADETAMLKQADAWYERIYGANR